MHRRLNRPVNKNEHLKPDHEKFKSRAYLETEVEVLYIDIFVWSSFALAPQQETLFGCHFLNGNILDGKS